jgi:hypothetical protein
MCVYRATTACHSSTLASGHTACKELALPWAPLCSQQFRCVCVSVCVCVCVGVWYALHSLTHSATYSLFSCPQRTSDPEPRPHRVLWARCEHRLCSDWVEIFSSTCVCLCVCVFNEYNYIYMCVCVCELVYTCIYTSHDTHSRTHSLTHPGSACDLTQASSTVVQANPMQDEMTLIGVYFATPNGMECVCV